MHLRVEFDSGVGPTCFFFHFSLGEEPTGVQSSLLWCLGGREIISVQAQIGEIIQGFTPIFMVFGPFFDGIW